jgi:hypothetical protein
MEPPKRKAGRPRATDSAEVTGPSLKITPDADRLLTQQAKKLGTTKSKYASAAIAYFAQNGLDPTKEQPKGLANVNDKVSTETRAIRVQNVDIGNRLISIIRAWEKTLYGFMQLQQGGLLSYMEKIEKNILSHQVAVETHFLAPMIEQMMKANIEAYMSRVVGEWSYLEIMKRPAGDWAAQDEKLNRERDQKLISLMQEFLKSHSVPTPQLSVKPPVAAAPGPAKVVPPAAPAIPDTPTSTTPTAPTITPATPR